MAVGCSRYIYIYYLLHIFIPILVWLGEFRLTFAKVLKKLREDSGKSIVASETFGNTLAHKPPCVCDQGIGLPYHSLQFPRLLPFLLVQGPCSFISQEQRSRLLHLCERENWTSKQLPRISAMNGRFSMNKSGSTMVYIGQYDEHD